MESTRRNKQTNKAKRSKKQEKRKKPSSPYFSSDRPTSIHRDDATIPQPTDVQTDLPSATWAPCCACIVIHLFHQLATHNTTRRARTAQRHRLTPDVFSFEYDTAATPALLHSHSLPLYSQLQLLPLSPLPLLRYPPPLSLHQIRFQFRHGHRTWCG